MQKLGINIKFKGNEQLDQLFKHYKILLDDCLQEVNKRYDAYQQIDAKEGKCPSCKEKKKLVWQGDSKKVCNSCFLRTWSEYTL